MQGLQEFWNTLYNLGDDFLKIYGTGSQRFQISSNWGASKMKYHPSPS